MSHQTSDTQPAADSRESLVAEAVDQFLECLGRGERPDVDEFAGRYPNIAELLRDVLPAVRAMHAPETLEAAGDRDSISPEVGGCLGDYQILCEIGRGGMGVVYEAEQISLQRRVALKILPFAAALDPRRLERFKNEAQAAAKLHHSNIVPIYAVGCERGVYYFAMQMIEGASLAQIIAQLKRLAEPAVADGKPTSKSPSETGDVLDEYMTVAPKATEPSVGQTHAPRFPRSAGTLHETPASRFDETQASAEAAFSTVGTKNGAAHCRAVARLGIQAAEALEHAHEMDVVHRDIKPANLLVDARGNLWVTDFGLARLQGDSSLTMTGDVVGTYLYMSPEQALGRNSIVDHRTDIYSLGATLYELLTLRPVCDSNSREDALDFLSSRDPVSLRRINRSIPTDLETIVLKALAKEPDGRYTTAREMADDLRSFLDSRPISAKRPTVMERAAKWSRRHRALVASTVVVLVLAVVGLAVSNVLIARERARTHKAYEEVADRQAATAAALDEEAKQRALAEENFQKARDMLDFVVQVSMDDLANIEEAEAPRARLLEASLDYYADFIRQTGDNPPLQAELAASHLRVAEILDGVGSTTAAKSALEKALETQERLVRENPDDKNLRRSLFNMYHQFGIFRGFLSLHLVARDAIQKHLQLSDRQVAKIDEIHEEQQRVYREFCDSRSTDLGRMRKEYLANREATKEAIAETLDEKQMKRLDQIVLQRRGVSAFSDPEIADGLELTAAQREKITAIQNEPRFPFSWPGPGRTPGRYGTIDKRIQEILTSAQEEKWKEMTGEPFSGDLKKTFGRRAPFGPGRSRPPAGS